MEPAPQPAVPPDVRVKAKRGPYRVQLDAGVTYYFCDCGRSKNQPFCDGSHVGTAFDSIPFSVTEAKTYALCGCKYSNKKPFCDGNHNRIEW
jgi:CDGSH-type Zn-finger protein